SSSSPSPAMVLFARGVIARLAIWETLTVAVQESWGGPGAKEKRTWMAGVLVDMFEEKQSKTTSSSTPSTDNSHVDPEDIEDTVLQIMADEFEVRVEDGSAEILGRDITRLWHAIMGQAAGAASMTTFPGEKMVQEWEERAEHTKGRKVQVQVQETAEEEGEWEDDDDEDEEEDDNEPMEDEAPQLIDQSKNREPVVDEDGFTLVSKRRR
ncbi:Pre-rRNA-processing protein TSR2-domain-containing protein, partial [Rhodocollybia butyracea]